MEWSGIGMERSRLFYRVRLEWGELPWWDRIGEEPPFPQGELPGWDRMGEFTIVQKSILNLMKRGGAYLMNDILANKSRFG